MLNLLKNLIYSSFSVLSLLFLNSLELNNYLINIILFFIIFIFIDKTHKYKKSTLLLSLILTILLLLGKYGIYLDESTGFLLFLKLISTFLGSYILFQHLFGFVFECLDNINIKKNVPISYKLSFILSFVIISISWLIILLIKYPGIIYPDTLNQIMQIFGDRLFNNMNPLFHTLLLKETFDIILSFTTNINLVVFIVSLFQLLLCSLIFSYVCYYIYKRTNNLYFYIFVLLFYGLTSYNVFYNISISKDTMYATFTVLFICMIDNLCKEPNVKNIILFIITSVFYSLLRNNGFYTLMVVILMILILNIKFNFKKTILVLVSTFVIIGAIRGPIYSVLLTNLNKNFENGANTTSAVFAANFAIVVPCQQIANVVVHERELNEKEEWLIEYYIPLDEVKEVYNPILVDTLFEHIKYTCKPTRLSINKIEYLKLWVELFLKYPLDYLEAYVNMNKYYFYPNRNVENMYYTSICPNEYGIEYINNNESLVNKVETIYDSQRDIPLASCVFSPGTIVFILMIGLYYCLLKKNKSTFISMLHLLINFLILMAFVPLNDEFRYIYPVVACLPLIITQTISNIEYKEGDAK